MEYEYEYEYYLLDFFLMNIPNIYIKKRKLEKLFRTLEDRKC